MEHAEPKALLFRSFNDMTTKVVGRQQGEEIEQQVPGLRLESRGRSRVLVASSWRRLFGSRNVLFASTIKINR